MAWAGLLNPADSSFAARRGRQASSWTTQIKCSVRQALATARTDGCTVSEVRSALGTTRKFALPLLGELDARGLTRRDGDVRRLVLDHPQGI